MKLADLTAARPKLPSTKYEDPRWAQSFVECVPTWPEWVGRSSARDVFYTCLEDHLYCVRVETKSRESVIWVSRVDKGRFLRESQAYNWEVVFAADDDDLSIPQNDLIEHFPEWLMEQVL